MKEPQLSAWTPSVRILSAANTTTDHGWPGSCYSRPIWTYNARPIDLNQRRGIGARFDGRRTGTILRRAETEC